MKICLILLFNLINLTLSKILDPIVWSVYSDMFKSTNTNEEYVIDVHLGEFLNILCPKYSINDDDKNLIEYHTLYKVSKSEYDNCQIQNTIETKQILRCDKPFDNVKYTLYISSYSPVPDAIEFIPGNSYYFISTSNTTFNGMNNTNGGTCLTNKMKIIVRVLDSNNKETSLTSKSLTTKTLSAAASSLTISNSDSIHKNKNLINTNLIYKLYTTTIKPIKNRLNSFVKKHKTVVKHTTKTIIDILTTEATKNNIINKTLNSSTISDSDLIIIQPDIEYAELLSLLQQQNQQQQQKQQIQTKTSSVFEYFHQINSSNSIFKTKIFSIESIILLFIINIIK